MLGGFNNRDFSLMRLMRQKTKRFQLLINSLDLRQPANETVRSKQEAIETGNKLGFPLIARPSYVWAGERWNWLRSVRA